MFFWVSVGITFLWRHLFAALLNEEHFTFQLQYKHSGTFANLKSYPQKSENVRPHSGNSIETVTSSSGMPQLASNKEVPRAITPCSRRAQRHLGTSQDLCSQRPQKWRQNEQNSNETTNHRKMVAPQSFKHFDVISMGIWVLLTRIAMALKANHLFFLYSSEKSSFNPSSVWSSCIIK